MQRGVSALMLACSEGYTAIVQLLLDNNANTNLQALVCLPVNSHQCTKMSFGIYLGSVHTHLFTLNWILSVCV